MFNFSDFFHFTIAIIFKVKDFPENYINAAESEITHKISVISQEITQTL